MSGTHRSTPSLSLDPLPPRYYNGTYTQATEFGAAASLSFNGTSVYIYGGKRPNHGLFNTSLDGTLYYDNGYSATNQFQQVLFPGQGLSTAVHNVSIVDSSSDVTAAYLDIDYVRSSLLDFFFLPLLTRRLADRLPGANSGRIPSTQTRRYPQSLSMVSLLCLEYQSTGSFQLRRR